MKTDCFFSQNGVRHIDYKDTDTLRKFLNPHGRLQARKRTGVCAKHQRQLSRAVKLSRQMGLLPFIIR